MSHASCHMVKNKMDLKSEKNVFNKRLNNVHTKKEITFNDDKYERELNTKCKREF